MTTLIERNVDVSPRGSGQILSFGQGLSSLNTNLDHVEWLVGSLGLCCDPAWIMERESSLAQASILASLVHVG